MFHYTYVTHDLEDASFYVGVRSCKVAPTDDPYLGSGIRLQRRVKKYGAHRFFKRVLQVFATRAEAVAAEAAHVTQSLLRIPGCLNLTTGGGGKPLNVPHRRPDKRKAPRQTKRLKEARLRNLAKASAANRGRKHTAEELQKLSEFWTGRKRGPFTEEHRRKIGEAVKKRTVSDETKARLGAAVKAAWARRRAAGTANWGKSTNKAE